MNKLGICYGNNEIIISLKSLIIKFGECTSYNEEYGKVYSIYIDDIYLDEDREISVDSDDYEFSIDRLFAYEYCDDIDVEIVNSDDMETCYYLNELSTEIIAQVILNLYDRIINW